MAKKANKWYESPRVNNSFQSQIIRTALDYLICTTYLYKWFYFTIIPFVCKHPDKSRNSWY